MTGVAIILVLTSAFIHAVWNFIAKRASTGGAAFLWWVTFFEVVLYLPLIIALVIYRRPEIRIEHILFTLGSGIIHFTYFNLLTMGYRVGDLSLVYPLSRGVGPVLSTAAAILFLNEHPTALALFGSLLVSGGIFVLTGDPRKLRESNALPGVMFAVLTGVSIAAYTIWDAIAVSKILIIPLLYQWMSGSWRLAFLTPLAFRQCDTLKLAWQQDKWKAVGVGFLGPLSYLLILMVLVFSPVSYVAPMRGIGTLVGVMMGSYFLEEGQMVRRLSAASAMVLGVIALSLG